MHYIREGFEDSSFAVDNKSEYHLFHLCYLDLNTTLNKPSQAKVGSNKLRVSIGFDQNRIRQTQLRADQD